MATAEQSGVHLVKLSTYFHDLLSYRLNMFNHKIRACLLRTLLINKSALCFRQNIAVSRLQLMMLCQDSTGKTIQDIYINCEVFVCVRVCLRPCLPTRLPARLPDCLTAYLSAQFPLSMRPTSTSTSDRQFMAVCLSLSSRFSVCLYHCLSGLISGYSLAVHQV